MTESSTSSIELTTAKVIPVVNDTSTVVSVPLSSTLVIVYCVFCAKPEIVYIISVSLVESYSKVIPSTGVDVVRPLEYPSR
ncbi:MAG: hypothetical protein TYPL_3930 [Candidatus Tyloplasma litorale]|nr:MAG: hypothetical protein TYPL_3930 [Mycoplasmatales bacterium]